MVRREIVLSKTSELAQRIARVLVHRKRSSEELANDRDALELVSFNLFLALQAASDVATHIIADKGWSSPDSVAGGFDQLARHGVISLQTATAMKRAARFRNVIAHGYAGVDVEAVQRASTDGVEDFDRFAKEVTGWLGRRDP